jgi:hypothetical protein
VYKLIGSIFSTFLNTYSCCNRIEQLKQVERRSSFGFCRRLSVSLIKIQLYIFKYLPGNHLASESVYMCTCTASSQVWIEGGGNPPSPPFSHEGKLL